MSTILTATELTVRYHEQVVLNGATLAIEPGERIGLVGRNGCGKTTFAKLAREQKLRERRLDKQAKKDARKHAPADHPERPGDTGHAATDEPSRPGLE